MALGGAPLVLTLCLWGWLAPGPGLGQQKDDDDMTQVAAPPHLVALIPEAAKATVAAGYIENGNEETTTKQAPLVSVSLAFSGGTSPEKETVLVVGDTRYAWESWSQWHCNCASGSMSRVRDITYSVPGVHLDPAEYDILRFEREPCTYQACSCKQGECNRTAVACEQGPVHMCALQDIKQDKEYKKKDFWSQVHKGLQDLWQSIKDTFPPEKEPKARHKQ